MPFFLYMLTVSMVIWTSFSFIAQIVTFTPPSTNETITIAISILLTAFLLLLTTYIIPFKHSPVSFALFSAIALIGNGFLFFTVMPLNTTMIALYVIFLLLLLLIVVLNVMQVFPTK
ncbi:hypothetical protein [Pontibacillus litoralis]|uniref:Uncharacterized protein n=1 Tax=Pontibacillus litoralis JSM 072002 TaxID=1385512 RepID=A0A0A5HMY5_9BACI|nr:hypothetical protein [Pontibacillus litoralis]KGX84967.1 hypothetical protein N784_11370 [Pontibacillus litoralis JSM 072002]